MKRIKLKDSAALSKNNIDVKHKIIDVSESIQFALTEANSQRQVYLINEFDNPKPRVGFNFCVQGSTSFALSGGYPTAFATPEYANTFVMPVCNVHQELTCETQLSLATFYVNITTFIKVVGESISVLPLNFLDTIETLNQCYFEKHRWQPIIKAVLSQIFNNRFSALTERIFIESKTLELMAVILELYSKGNPKQFTISKGDVEKIHYAHDLLVKDLAQPPSLSKLARMAGTNEYTLKKGFKEIFEMPVFKYLKQVRLSKAYELFQSTNLQVSEVALIIGYESVSSFTRAFVEMYGLRPGEVKRIPFRTI